MATRKITVLDEGAPLLGAGLPPIRTKVGGPLPPSASRRASSGATNGTTRSTMGAFAAAVLLVTGAGGAAYRYRTHQLREGEMTAVAARTLDRLQEKPQWCNSCAVVVPTDTYADKGWGQQIDAADCVVRFNDATTGTKSPEDLGMKDTIRVISADGPGNPAWRSPCALGGGCEREFVAYDVAADPAGVAAVANAPEIELLSVLAGFLNTGDPHVALRNYATANAYPSTPTWASPGFVAVDAMKHPRMCGSVAIYGVAGAAADAEDPTGDHDYPLEHHLMREAVASKAPGWENVRIVDMDASANEVWAAGDDSNSLAFAKVTTMFTPPTHLVPASAEPKGLDKLKVDPTRRGTDTTDPEGPDPNAGSGAAGAEDAVAGLSMKHSKLLKKLKLLAPPTETADAKGNARAGSASYPQPWTTPKNAIEAEEARAAFAQPWTDGSETDWSAYDKNNHEKNLEQKAAWSGVLGEWDAANEPHRAVYVPKKVYRHRGAPTTMAQAGRGIALPGE